jgi:hypothetical protein
MDHYTGLHFGHNELTDAGPRTAKKMNYYETYVLNCQSLILTNFLLASKGDRHECVKVPPTLNVHSSES